MFHTEEERREQLREIAERLLELADDGTKFIRFVNEEIRASICSACNDYADDIYEEYRVSYSDKKEDE